MSWLAVSTTVVAMATLAAYNYLSIKGKTYTHLWHALQYLTILTLVIEGVVLDRLVQSQASGWVWHDIGNIAALILGPALISYIGVLRGFQKWGPY